MNRVYRIDGCLLPGLLLLFLLVLAFKFWWLILGFFGVLYLLVLLKTLKSKKSVYKEFEPKPGEVYKECPACSAKNPRSAEVCARCGSPFV